MRYELSLEADRDLEDIFDHTYGELGVAQAAQYVSSFDDVLEALAANPHMGRTRDEVRAGLRSVVKEHHVVFYRLLDDRIRIVRILHGSRDLPRYFSA